MYTYHFKKVCLCLVALLLLILTMACGGFMGAGTPPPDRGSSNNTPRPRDADSGGASQPDGAPQTVAVDEGDPTRQPDVPGVDNSELLPITPGVARVTDTGFLVIPGTVENRTGTWINLVKVSIRLYDKDGKELTATDTLGQTPQRIYTSNEIVPPGEMGYFHYIRELDNIEGAYDHYELMVQAYETDVRAVPDILDLVVEDTPEDSIAIRGKLSNSSSEDCKYPAAIIVAFTEDGLVYSVESDYPEDDVKLLELGASAPFSYTLRNGDSKIDSVKIVSTCANY